MIRAAAPTRLNLAVAWILQHNIIRLRKESMTVGVPPWERDLRRDQARKLQDVLDYMNIGWVKPPGGPRPRDQANVAPVDAVRRAA